MRVDEPDDGGGVLDSVGMEIFADFGIGTNSAMEDELTMAALDPVEIEALISGPVLYNSTADSNLVMFAFHVPPLQYPIYMYTSCPDHTPTAVVIVSEPQVSYIEQEDSTNP